MKKIRKLFVILLTLAIVVSSLSGCSGGSSDDVTTDNSVENQTSENTTDDSNSEDQAQAPEGAKELIFWSQWGGDNKIKFQELIDEYNNTEGKENNIFVKIEQVEDENNEMMMKLMAAQLSNTMPDIVHVAQMSFIAMARNNLFSEPSAEVQQYVQDNYFDANAQLAEFNGTWWGYPTEHQVMALFWNKDHFAEVGLEGPPKTWDEMREYAKKLTIRNDSGELERAGFVFPFDFSEAMMTQHISMFWGAGQDLFPDEKTTNVNSDVGIKLNELYKGLADDGSTNANWLPWADALNTGKGSMVMMDPWALNFNVKEKGIDGLYEAIAVAELPTPDGKPGASMSRGFELCVTSGSKYSDEAWSFLKWLNEEPECRMNKFMVETFEFLPSHKGFDFPENWSQDTKDTYAKILEISKPQPDLLNYEEVQQSIDNMKDDILISGGDPLKAAENCEKELTSILVVE